jgi:hypothetical protein
MYLLLILKIKVERMLSANGWTEPDVAEIKAEEESAVERA